MPAPTTAPSGMVWNEQAKTFVPIANKPTATTTNFSVTPNPVSTASPINTPAPVVATPTAPVVATPTAPVVATPTAPVVPVKSAMDLYLENQARLNKDLDAQDEDRRVAADKTYATQTQNAQTAAQRSMLLNNATTQQRANEQAMSSGADVGSNAFKNYVNRQMDVAGGQNVDVSQGLQGTLANLAQDKLSTEQSLFDRTAQQKASNNAEAMTLANLATNETDKSTAKLESDIAKATAYYSKNPEALSLLNKTLMENGGNLVNARATVEAAYGSKQLVDRTPAEQAMYDAETKSKPYLTEYNALMAKTTPLTADEQFRAQSLYNTLDAMKMAPTAESNKAQVINKVNSLADKSPAEIQNLPISDIVTAFGDPDLSKKLMMRLPNFSNMSELVRSKDWANLKGKVVIVAGAPMKIDSIDQTKTYNFVVYKTGLLDSKLSGGQNINLRK
jgi:hypothetical protein